MNLRDNESGRHIQEDAGKMVRVVWICHEKGGRMCWEHLAMRMDVEGRRRKGEGSGGGWTVWT